MDISLLHDGTYGSAIFHMVLILIGIKIPVDDLEGHGDEGTNNFLLRRSCIRNERSAGQGLQITKFPLHFVLYHQYFEQH